MRSRRARRVYYATSLEYETEIEGGGLTRELVRTTETATAELLLLRF